jgi:hypothetical protein
MILHKVFDFVAFNVGKFLTGVKFGNNLFGVEIFKPFFGLFIES